MISLIQYAKETADRPVDFLEYLNLFTGYDLNSPKRTDKECQEIYADFEKKFSEHSFTWSLLTITNGILYRNVS